MTAQREQTTAGRSGKCTQRIDRCTPDTHLEVQVRTGRVARRSDEPDPDSLSDPDAKAHVDP